MTTTLDVSLDMPLTQWQHLSICAALAERSFPNYALYCEIEHLTDSNDVRKMLNKVWEYLRGQLKSLKNLEHQLEKLPPLFPNLETTEHFGAYPAMDLLVAVQSCLQGTLDNSLNDAEAILTMVRSRLEEVLGMQGLSLDESELWARHLEYESNIIALVTQQGSHAEIIKALIPLAKDKGISELGICLED